MPLEKLNVITLREQFLSVTMHAYFERERERESCIAYMRTMRYKILVRF